MSNTTAENEIQVVLQDYLGNKEVSRLAKTLYATMQKETPYAYNNKKFYVHEDSNGALVLTMESITREPVEKILLENLKANEVQECFARLLRCIPTKTAMNTQVETITVEGSNSQVYLELLKHTPYDRCEKQFLDDLLKAVAFGVETFEVPIYDPSIDENERLQFVPGCWPAVYSSFDMQKKLAKDNGVRLGSKNQYVLFLATLIHRMIEEGWSSQNAFSAVCTDSAELGNYCISEDNKNFIEKTGSRRVAGKFDLANTCKFLAEDGSTNGYYLAGGNYLAFGHVRPLAHFFHYVIDEPEYPVPFGVGWFVL